MHHERKEEMREIMELLDGFVLNDYQFNNTEKHISKK
jgi:hypothetical protein